MGIIIIVWKRNELEILYIRANNSNIVVWLNSTVKLEVSTYYILFEPYIYLRFVIKKT